MKVSIVLGAIFGDEGKGLTTSYLVSQSKSPLVIRFCGGHNAGHMVHNENVRHVFSTFGSGTLQGAPTFISRFCTFYPTAAYNEYNELVRKGVTPELYVDPLAMVTTPYDYMANQSCDKHKVNGTVGVGLGYTIKRHEAYYKLYVQDLFCETVLRAKMDNIRDYYVNVLGFKFNEESLKHKINFWYNAITQLLEKGVIWKGFPKDNKFDHLIFEGSQGIMLDMDYGLFPNVTRSNTTSKNALIVLSELLNTDHYQNIDIYYITRCYQTRHGNGFISHEGTPVELIKNEHETNKDGGHQGKFRTAPLDIDLLNYAIQCDGNHSKQQKVVNSKMNGYENLFNKHLVITCIDQMPDQENIPYFINGELKKGSISTIISDIGMSNFSSIIGSYSDDGKRINQVTKL